MILRSMGQLTSKTANHTETAQVTKNIKTQGAMAIPEIKEKSDFW